MLDGLKALVALESIGTLSGAAVRLRLTQSALSKRIQSLEAELGYRVVEPNGRKLKLTSQGQNLLAKAKPLILEVEGLKDLKVPITRKHMAIGISDSIASSWGPSVVKKTLKKIDNLDLEIHVHRSTLIIEQLLSGRYELGILTGQPQGNGLMWSLLTEEPMALVGQTRESRDSKVLLSIETNSATWKEIGRELLKHPVSNGKEFLFLESFSAAIQMAKAGFGQAIVPIGLAQAYGLRTEEVVPLSPRIKRQIHLVKRKTIAEFSQVKELYKVLRETSKDAF